MGKRVLGTPVLQLIPVPMESQLAKRLPIAHLPVITDVLSSIQLLPLREGQACEEILATPSPSSKETGMPNTQPGSPGLPDLVLLYLPSLTSLAALVQECR